MSRCTKRDACMKAIARVASRAMRIRSAQVHPGPQTQGHQAASRHRIKPLGNCAPRPAAHLFPEPDDSAEDSKLTGESALRAAPLAQPSVAARRRCRRRLVAARAVAARGAGRPDVDE